MEISEELEKLTKLRADGAISEEEFTKAKARLLNDPAPATSSPYTPPQNNLAVDPNPTGEQPNFNVNQWAMFLHLSQLANCIVPLAGIVAPIVLWQMKEDESAVIDRHGKMVVNWLISAFIYCCVCVGLFFLIIPVLVLILIGIASVIFAIVGGIKANNGEFWEYPITIKFLK